jgi:PAS domain S-box-containing protein
MRARVTEETPAPAPADPVAEELARETVRSAGRSDLAHAVLVVVLAALFVRGPFASAALPWLGLVLLAVAIRAAVRWRVRESPPEEARRVVRLAVLLVAAAWAVGPAVALADAPFDQFAVIVVVFAGIAAGGSGTLISDRASFYTLIGVLSLGLLVGLMVREPSRVHTITALLVVLFAVVIGAAYERSHATLRELIASSIRLREQERSSVHEREYLGALLASAPTAIATVDGRGLVRDVNPAFERLFGYSVEEALGRQLDDLVVPDEARATAREFTDRVLGGGGTLVVEVERRRKDGQRVPVRVSAGLVRGVDDPTIFVLYDDITVTRRAQEALREAERAYRELVESASDLVWKLDREGRWEFLNSAAGEIYGLEPDALIGRPLAERVAPPHRERDLARFAQVLEGGELADYETVHRAEDGGERHLSFSARPVRDLDGTIVGAQGTARDVTARAEARAALIEAREAAERVAALRSAFVANMSHEIRTPLNGILGLVELLLDSELSPDQRRSVELIRTSGDALLSVVNDVLDFSKIEAGRMELEDVGFDVGGLVESTARLLAVRAASRGLEVVVDLAPDVPRAVMGDPGRLRQVLTNLIGNAIKFTKAGEIVISVRREPGSGDPPHMRFAVRDTGIGIPPDRLEAIFEEFTQADLSTSREFGGTGLGLALCRRLVGMMHGEIHVRSEPGTGSEFWFTVPLRTRGAEAAGGPAPPPPRMPVGGRALVVDDSASNRRIVREILRMAGMQVDDAADAAGGFARLRAAGADQPYDVVVLDGHMPGRDGFALAADIRADPHLRSTRLIMLTSAANRGDGQRCRNLGIDGYLTKPVVRVEFLEAVAAVVSADEARHPDPLVTRHSMKENRQRLRVLVAEDNPVNQHVARSLLERRGHTVEVVANGQLAVEAMRGGTYDVVLMDLQMPVMDGLTATQRIRELPACGTVPIIALTAHALAEDRERCLAAGMTACVTKPFRPHDLFAEIEGWGLPQPPPAAPEPERVVDLTGLRHTMREAGVEDAVGDLIQTFLGDCPGRLTAIEEAEAAGDPALMERAAHAYKSAAGAIRAGVLTDLLGKLEAAARARDTERARRMVPDVRRAHEAVVRELTAEMASAHG